MAAFELVCLKEATPQLISPAASAGDTISQPITLLGASGRKEAFKLTVTVNQSGTAGYDVDFFNVVESAIGSGSKFLLRRQVGGVDKFSVDNTGRLLVGDGSASLPSIAFVSDPDTGFFHTSANTVNLSVGGTAPWQWSIENFGPGLTITNGPHMFAEETSATNPVFAFGSDPDTGLGSAAADQASIIAGGVEALRLSEASSQILVQDSLQAGLTAGTTQTQAGGLQLLSSYNEVATVANQDDTVVLPEAVIGRGCTIRNNGANRIQIFPAVNDDLGAGVDLATTLETNESIIYRAFDAINWRPESTTSIVHAEMHDEDNTDAFVVNDAGGDFHAYHTNGLVIGDAQGWTFDAGGAGTSHAITVIADGAASGVDIKVTTGTAHGLAVGAIISQTNLANAAYVGFFVVKAIIDTTNYEVAAVFTATGTGTMDEAATLVCGVGFSGDYQVSYYSSATTATNNETFDFVLNKQAANIVGTKVRRKFGTAADFGSFSGGGVVVIADNDKISLALSNEDSGGDLTIRNLNVILSRL